jgi:hypothetical protein
VWVGRKLRKLRGSYYWYAACMHSICIHDDVYVYMSAGVPGLCMLLCINVSVCGRKCVRERESKCVRAQSLSSV